MDEEEWIVGVNAVGQVLRRRPGDVQLLELAASRAGARGADLESEARALGVAVRRVEREALDRRFPGLRHQGVAARVRAARMLPESRLEELVAVPDALVLVLDQVQDPRNLGACLRSAAAAGAHAVVLPRDRSAPLSPAARKAAAGAAEWVPLVQVTNLARALDQLKAAGLWLVGADGAADSPLWSRDLLGPLGLVLGSEGQGLRRLTRERCDFLARIPMAGGFDSLNVSVAAGVFLFEAVRQRMEPSP